MSRSEINNPTARMGKVLDDFDALDHAYDDVVRLISEWVQAGVISPETFEELMPKPAATAVAEERVRRQLTLGKVEYKRDYMRRARAIQPEVVISRELTSEDEAKIMAELDALPPNQRD